MRQHDLGSVGAVLGGLAATPLVTGVGPRRSPGCTAEIDAGRPCHV